MDTSNWIMDYNLKNSGVNTTTTGSGTTACDDLWTSPSYRYWGWPVSYESPNRTEQAFAVAKQLIKDKVVECHTSKQFIELVDTIKKAL